MYVIRYDDRQNSTTYYIANAGFTPNLQTADVWNTTDDLIRYLMTSIGAGKGDRRAYPGTYTIIKVETSALREVSKIS